MIVLAGSVFLICLLCHESHWIFLVAPKQGPNADIQWNPRIPVLSGTGTPGLSPSAESSSLVLSDCMPPLLDCCHPVFLQQMGGSSLAPIQVSSSCWAGEVHSPLSTPRCLYHVALEGYISLNDPTWICTIYFMINTSGPVMDLGIKEWTTHLS